MRLYYFTAINRLLLWLQRVEKYHRSPNMPHICRTKRHFLGEPFCVARWSPFHIHYFLCICVQRLAPFTFFIFVFSYSRRQIFLPTARNTWSGRHHQKSLCDLGAFEEPVGSLVILLSADTLVVFQKWHPGSWMCTIFKSVLTDQGLMGLSHKRWWMCHFPSPKQLLSQYGYEQCDPMVSFPLSQ